VLEAEDAAVPADGIAVVLSGVEMFDRALAPNPRSDQRGVVLDDKWRGELVVAELEDSPERARTVLDRLRILISNTLDEARRSVWNLRPASLEQRNLASALQDSAREAALNTPIQVKVQVDGQPRPLPGPTESNLLRIGQEAVNNAIKHSRARSVQMELHYEPAFVRLLVQDDGCGFDPQRPVNAAPDHFGLTAMRERAEKLGGRLFITSSPGEGAIIEAEIPG
jgi:signal transduction histidine kinase